jgi:outer membrane biosynthesis protein TonB
MPSTPKREPSPKPKPKPKPKPSRVKVRQHRERLRALGLRPVQIWVPDVRARAFRSQARRQSLAIATSRHARADQAFIDAVSDRDDE